MQTLGIVGATGVVGQTLLEIIEQSENNFDQIKLFASKSSAGKIVTLGKIKIPIEEVNLKSLLQCNAVVFA